MISDIAAKDLRKHIKKIDYPSISGKNLYFLKTRNSHITLNIYRDEFPEGIKGRQQMDLIIDNIYRYIELCHPLISIMANIVFRSKKNMKSLRRYP